MASVSHFMHSFLQGLDPYFASPIFRVTCYSLFWNIFLLHFLSFPSLSTSLSELRTKFWGKKFSLVQFLLKQRDFWHLQSRRVHCFLEIESVSPKCRQYRFYNSGKTHTLMSKDGLTVNMVNLMFSKIWADTSSDYNVSEICCIVIFNLRYQLLNDRIDNLFCSNDVFRTLLKI